MEEKQKGDDGDDIKENEEEIKQHGEKKAQTEDEEDGEAEEKKDSVTTEQDNGKEIKEKDSVKRLPLDTLGTRFPVRGLGGGGFLFTIRGCLYRPPPPRGAYCPFN